MKKILYTVGHSRHSAEAFLALLERFEIRVLVDIRRYPGSKKFPHFRKENLAPFLEAHGLGYKHLEGLGGWRRPRPDSPNTALTSPGFRGYADHMQTAEFQKALAELLELAGRGTTAVMCAEALPWCCHRWFLSDLLTAKGFRVFHILPDGTIREHRCHPLARLKGDFLIYG